MRSLTMMAPVAREDEGLRAMGSVHAYVAHCGLPKPLIDLVYLRASQINGSADGIDAHTRDALEDGADATKLMLLSAWREAGAWFSGRERAALAWTEAVSLVAPTRVPDADYEAATAQFSGRELADLAVAIGLVNAWNRIASSFRRGPDSRPPDA